MANLAIQGHATRGKEVIELLEMLDGNNIVYELDGSDTNAFYYIHHDYIDADHKDMIGEGHPEFKHYTLEEFLEKFPYKVGDKVQCNKATSCGSVYVIEQMKWEDNQVKYVICDLYWKNCKCTVISKDLQPYKEQEPMEDKGNISDGYHTFNELYEYRLLYNASMFNELAKQGLYDVHKSKLHSDGTIPFGDENWFIVQAELPTGQISNHYEMKDWDLFQVPVKEKANLYDGHSPQDVAKRLREFLTPKPQYPKTYEECCDIINNVAVHTIFNSNAYNPYLIYCFQKLLICRDAYWKIAGEQMGLGKPWETNWDNVYENHYTIVVYKHILKTSFNEYSNRILIFPTEEMRDAFYENFKDLIEQCKELL